MRMTYTIAHRLGWDAADRQMRAAGRTAWNEADAELPAQTFRRHLPLCSELPGVAPELCGCERCRAEQQE